MKKFFIPIIFFFALVAGFGFADNTKAGALGIDVSLDTTTLPSQSIDIGAGFKTVDFVKIKFSNYSTPPQDVSLSRFTVFVYKDDYSTLASSKDVFTLSAYDGDLKLKETTNYGSGTFMFYPNEVVIPANSSKIITIKGQITSLTTAQKLLIAMANLGDESLNKFFIDSSTEMGGFTGSGGPSVVGNWMNIIGTNPIVKIEKDSSVAIDSSVSADNTVSDFNVFKIKNTSSFNLSIDSIKVSRLESSDGTGGSDSDFGKISLFRKQADGMRVQVGTDQYLSNGTATFSNLQLGIASKDDTVNSVRTLIISAVIPSTVKNQVKVGLKIYKGDVSISNPSQPTKGVNIDGDVLASIRTISKTDTTAPSTPIYKLIKPVGDIVRGKNYTFITEISNTVPDAPIFINLQRPNGSMKYDSLNIGKKSDKTGYWKGDDISRFITIEGQNGTWTSWISVAGVVSNKLYHNVIGSETQISQETINIKGRLIDKTTSLPIKGVAIYTGDGGGGRAINPIYTGDNGEFNISTDKNFSIAKMFPFWPSCYIQGSIFLKKLNNGKIAASFDVDLSNTVNDTNIDVIENKADLGDISLWPAVDINIVSDIPVKFTTIRDGEVGGGNENYKTSHITSNTIPLNHDVTIELLDEFGMKYISPIINLPLSNSCKPAILSFLNKQFSWNKIPDNSLVKSPSDPTVYVIKDGKKQPISSPQEFEQSGYKWDQIKTVQADLLKQIADLKAQISQLREELKKTGTLIKNPNGPEVYVITQEGKKQHITSPQEFSQKGYKWDQIQTVTSDEISQIPDFTPGQKAEGVYPNGTLIKSENDPTVYIIVNGKKKPIPDPATFNNWGLKWDQIKEVPASKTGELEDIKVSSDIVRAQGNDKIYRIIGDKKLWIPTVQAFLGSGYKPNTEIDISQDDIADFEDVKYIKIKGGRYVYEIKDNKKYRITDTSQIPAQDIKPVTLAEFTAYPIGK